MKERNRALKVMISKAFAPHKVTVKGSRGTAYGWATIHIFYSPRNWEEQRELTAKVWEIIRAAKINIPTYGYDDPGSDYGHGSCLHINFDECQDRIAAREALDDFNYVGSRHHY